MNTATERSLTLEMAKKAGFDHVAYAEIENMESLPELRETCASNVCGNYNKRWSCPPACGEREDILARVQTYDYGILLQATEKMEDDFDWDAIQKSTKRCTESLKELIDMAKSLNKENFPMAVGGCKVCKDCTYPDEACRFPDKLILSPSTCGFFLSRECEKVGLEFSYGPQTSTSIAILFIKE